jgi:hypothetical protein
MYHWQGCFGRPIASAPDAWFDVVERYSNDSNKTLQYTISYIMSCSFVCVSEYANCLSMYVVHLIWCIIDAAVPQKRPNALTWVPITTLVLLPLMSTAPLMLSSR